MHEAANSTRCAANLGSRQSRVRGQVAAPAVDLGRTSHRVLTMEFVEGKTVAFGVGGHVGGGIWLAFRACGMRGVGQLAGGWASE
jgi:hypothetical protein